MNDCTGSQHAYASTTIVHPPSFKGTEVILNVWEPLVEPHCFSLAQLWLINTGLAFPYNSSDGLLNTIEAGWQVLYEIISEIFNYFLQNFVQYCLFCISWGSLDFPPTLAIPASSYILTHDAPSCSKILRLCELITPTSEPNLWSLANYPIL